ncbi:MAG: nicotinamide-nucleotide amidase [Planctomycetota bacterium]
MSSDPVTPGPVTPDPMTPATLRAEVVSIGDELVHAGMIDTNSSYISGQLGALGVSVQRFTVVGDDPADLQDAIDGACRRADVVIATGGLGPTLDDRTREVVAKLLQEPLRFDEPSWQQLLAWFARHVREVPDSNRRQAELPQSATALVNAIGTAPGFRVTVHGAELFTLPGVPREMKLMLADHVLPAVQHLGALQPTAQACLRVLGPSEALLGERLAEFMKPGRNPAVGITASGGLLSVRLIGTADSKVAAAALCEQTAAELRPLLGDWLFVEGLQEMPELVLDRLLSQQRTVAFAESCTGGLCAARLTNLPGSSQVLQGGVVAYSNAAKQEFLAVPESLLEEHGAVSEPVAAAMAAGARERFAADCAIATTGIAGPAGGTDQKPVGTVCFAVATANEAGSTVTKAWTVPIANLGRTFVRDRAVHEVWRALLL